jgi:sorbitol-specific phosphotransferase system component IIBC
MERSFLRAICGAATGAGIGVILLVIGLYIAWPRHPMEDSAIGLTFVIIVLAIPFLVLTSGVGAIVGMVVDFVLRITMRRRQTQEETFPSEDRD